MQNAPVFFSRIADQRYSFSERLFYSYVFALVVLLPASLYLEEAFEALNFQHRRQFRFLLGSVFSAAAGVALSLCQARLKEDPAWFGRLHHLGRLYFRKNWRGKGGTVVQKSR